MDIKLDFRKILTSKFESENCVVLNSQGLSAEVLVGSYVYSISSEGKIEKKTGEESATNMVA